MYSQAFDDAQAACLELVGQIDVESDVAQNPQLIGGVQPDDPLWPEARALYVEMIGASCYYDKAAATDALSATIAANLTEDELVQLITFYRTPLGQRFVAASLLGNNAANRAAEPLNDVNESYRIFAEKLVELLRREGISSGH